MTFGGYFIKFWRAPEFFEGAYTQVPQNAYLRVHAGRESNSGGAPWMTNIQNFEVCTKILLKTTKFLKTTFSVPAQDAPYPFLPLLGKVRVAVEILAESLRQDLGLRHRLLHRRLVHARKACLEIRKPSQRVQALLMGREQQAFVVRAGVDLPGLVIQRYGLRLTRERAYANSYIHHWNKLIK